MVLIIVYNEDDFYVELLFRKSPVMSSIVIFLSPISFAMNDSKKISNALISVYYKDNLSEVIQLLHQLDIKIFSTGGTFDFIEKCGIPATKIESLTGFPSMLGGRVKTLHPAVFGGILNRRHHPDDQKEMVEYGIPPIDLVLVDLYPFEETLMQTTDEDEILEKIDIGGISLIRAAAKNFRDVLVVPHKDLFPGLISLLKEKSGFTSLEDRKRFAAGAFQVSSHYDTAIFNYINSSGEVDAFKVSVTGSTILRYGENPHQKGKFFGNLQKIFEQLHGKEISFNNLLDIDAALHLIREFHDTAFAIIKHNNACGLASRSSLKEAYLKALEADPVSAFGGILVCNRPVDMEAAGEINKLFFEILISPGYDEVALELLKSKKNRIILRLKEFNPPDVQYRSCLDGVLFQEKDTKKEQPADLKPVTRSAPGKDEITDLLFANILVKHSKSNAIVLVRNQQLLASGVGQTSRVDALKQAIAKAGEFNLSLEGAVMASDAFFPFSDSVEIAYKAGIKAVIQPGGSIRDQETIDFCNQHNIKMVFTGYRHFKH